MSTRHPESLRKIARRVRLLVTERITDDVWRFTSLAAVAIVATGLLPWDETSDVTRRMAPILLFLVAITVLAELAEVAMVFDIAAREAAHLARGRTPVLFLLVAGLATLTTILLGLDTTAVLLTPVVLSLAAQLQLSPLPFAMVTIWLANTASLLLPVSNLTNLLALRRLHLSPHEFFTRMWLPTVVSVVLTVVVLGLRYHRDLGGTYETPHHPGVTDRLLFVLTTLACLGLVPGVLLGGDPTIVVTVAAVALVVVFAVRRRAALRLGLLPWRLTLFVLGLALVVEAVLRHGGDRVVASVTREGDGLGTMLDVAGVGAVSSNLLNNLPAYLVVEPDAAGGGPSRLLALLIGTNVGPLVLLWGSLATLLWRERCKAGDVDVSAVQFASMGLLGVPIVLVASTAALSLS
jgi:arsenical pump membrane protein